MTSIIEFLEARITEDEAVAKAAIDPDRPGSHWHWVTDKTDTIIAPGDCLAAIEEQSISLRSVEEFTGRFNARPLPAFALSYVEEIATAGVGDHIANWDPARVLAECNSKRAIIRIAVDQIRLGKEAGSWNNWEDMANQTLHALAAVHSDHPDYQAEWKAQ